LAKGAAWAAIVGFLVANAVAFVVLTDVSRPLRTTLAAMRDLRRGETDVRLTLETGDEFEKLAKGFNSMVQSIQQREERLSKHYEVAKLLISTIDLDELLEKALDIVVSVTGSHLGIVYVLQDDRLRPLAQFGASAELRELAHDEGYPGRAAAEKRFILLRQPEDVVDEMLDLGFAKVAPREIAYIPLMYQERVLGVLTLGRAAPYRDEDKDLFDYLASQISMALDNALLHAQMRELSITDGLTGLANRRRLNERLVEGLARSRRNKAPLSVLLLDLDNFKRVNDVYGHDKGDDALRAVAHALRTNVRATDLAARFGGEEFVMLLENADAKQARVFAERIAQSLRDLRFDWKEGGLSASVGVASYPENEAYDAESLLKLADQCMYTAKLAGKDRVVLASELG